MQRELPPGLGSEQVGGDPCRDGPVEQREQGIHHDAGAARDAELAEQGRQLADHDREDVAEEQRVDGCVVQQQPRDAEAERDPQQCADPEPQLSSEPGPGHEAVWSMATPRPPGVVTPPPQRHGERRQRGTGEHPAGLPAVGHAAGTDDRQAGRHGEPPTPRS